MFAHKHRPRGPVFTVVMAALGYSTNRTSHLPPCLNICISWWGRLVDVSNFFSAVVLFIFFVLLCMCVCFFN